MAGAANFSFEEMAQGLHEIANQTGYNIASAEFLRYLDEQSWYNDFPHINYAIIERAVDAYNNDAAFAAYVLRGYGQQAVQNHFANTNISTYINNTFLETPGEVVTNTPTPTGNDEDKPVIAPPQPKQVTDGAPQPKQAAFPAWIGILGIAAIGFVFLKGLTDSNNLNGIPVIDQTELNGIKKITVNI